MLGQIKYVFSAKIWQHNAPGGWCFVSLPLNMSNEIREHLGFQEEGWGRMKAEAEINDLRWQTAIWFDSKHKTYILPVKSAIRKKLQLSVDQELELAIYI